MNGLSCVLLAAALFCFAMAHSALAAAPPFGTANQICEFSFTSSKTYPDPFNEVELDLIFTAPSGDPLRVPAFWSGGNTWRAR